MNDDQDRQPQADPMPSEQAAATPDGPASEGAAGSGGAVTLSYARYEELKSLALERDDYLRRLQRAVADYQNLQKRVERFQGAAREAALRSLADDLLPVADSLARALEAAEKADGADGIVEGLHLVEKEFYGALAGVGIRPVEALGQKFDPHYHEAAMQLPVAEVPPNTVVQELKKGFVLGETVVRPTQVVVSRAPDPSG
jgi:molecular chaperone GrpE